MARSYLDFEPDYQFREEEDYDIIEFQVQGFRKNHLSIHLGSNGVLTVSGERPLGGTTWLRLRKEFNPPKECKASEIRARLSSGVLRLTIPKKITTQVSQQEPITPLQQVSSPKQDKEKLKQQSSLSKEADQAFTAKQSSEARDSMTTRTGNATLPEAGHKSFISSLKMGRKTAAKVVASVTVLSLLFTMLFYIFKCYASMIMDVSCFRF